MSQATETSRVELTARAKAFTGRGIEEHRFLVDLDTETVRVWDSIAGHYTTCHSLSASAIRRILKLASKA